MNKYLVVIDMQEDFVNEALVNPQAQAIVEPILQELKQWPHSIVFTQDTHYSDYLKTSEGAYLPVEHCIKGSYGHKIVKPLYDYICYELPEHRDCKIYEKPTFGYLDWKQHLVEPEYIELCGTVASICVVSNALILKAMFPECIVAVNPKLIAGMTETDKAAALEVMANCQVRILED